MYWHPLYAYIRWRVADVNEAQDLTQAFFAELLEKNYVQRHRNADAFERFCCSRLPFQTLGSVALKRGGSLAFSLEFQAADSSVSS